MNLRILKKLSKRAAPLLPLLGDHHEQFRSERGDNYHGMVISARKHWERTRIHPSHREGHKAGEIIYTSRAGHRISLRRPSHPREGTIMVGAMEGYYEPEWNEECAYGALCKIVFCEFTDWDAQSVDEDVIPGLLRPLSTPALIFAAAHDLVQRRAA